MLDTETKTTSFPSPGPKLASALAKAQGQIKPALKTQENSAFTRPNKKSMYANLSDVIEAVQTPAYENGLSLFFNFKQQITDKGVMHFIKYTLLHISGEFVESEWILMMLRDQTMHGFAAGNTFYRRQLIKAIYQLPEEDDDGNSQSLPHKPHKAPPKNYAPGGEDIDRALASDPMPDYEGAQESLTLLDQLVRLAEAKNIPADKMRDYIKLSTGSTKRAKELTDAELATVISFLKMK